AIEFTRPMTTPRLPYRICGLCHYVAKWEEARERCPGCGTPTNGEGMFWPEGTLCDLWDDEVLCWNKQKPELATIVAAFYYEASAYNLLHKGLEWLDPEFTIIGAEVLEYPKQEAAI